jgi:hypothetical protein
LVSKSAFLVFIPCSGFCVAQHRNVFAGLDEFSRLEDGGIIGSIDSGQKFSYLGWISPQAGIGQTRRATSFQSTSSAINFKSAGISRRPKAANHCQD